MTFWVFFFFSFFKWIEKHKSKKGRKTKERKQESKKENTQTQRAKAKKQIKKKKRRNRVLCFLTLPEEETLLFLHMKKGKKLTRIELAAWREKQEGLDAKKFASDAEN